MYSPLCQVHNFSQTHIFVVNLYFVFSIDISTSDAIPAVRVAQEDIGIHKFGIRNCVTQLL